MRREEWMRVADSRVLCAPMKASTKLFVACASGAGAVLLFACSIDVTGADLFASGPPADASTDGLTAYHADVVLPADDAAEEAETSTIGGGSDDGGDAGHTGDASDASTHDAADAAPAVDAAVAPVRCGGGVFNVVECQPATEECCATGTSTGFSYACIPHGSACGGITIGCAAQADCKAPNVCCDHHPAGGREAVQCLAASACGTEPRLCDPLASDCAQGQLCLPYANGIPYYACH